MLIRKAKAEDIDLLFKWVNDLSNRINRVQSKHVISYEEHQKWYDEKLKDGTLIFIGEVEDIPIGNVRAEEKKNIEISVFIDYDFRQKGYASALIKYATEIAQEVWPHKDIVANILEDNLASIKLFTKNGFKLYKKQGVYNTFKYEK